MNLLIPEKALVLLIGPSGAGKSTFASKHFRVSEVLSSDYCRYLVSDDANNQAATNDAFEVLHLIAAKRLAAGKLVVVDATNVQPFARKPLLALAERYYASAVAIVLKVPQSTCLQRNQVRTDRTLPPAAIASQYQELAGSLEQMEQEGFRSVYVLENPEQIASVRIERLPA